MQQKTTELKEKSAQYILENPSAPRRTVYYLWREEQAAAGNEIMRTGGAPVGFASAADFPLDKKGARMEHILTLNVERLPRLAAQVPEGTKGVALFVSNPPENEAYSAHSGYAALRFLTAADLAAAPAACADYTPYSTPAKAVGMAEIEIPIACLETISENPLIVEARKLLMNAPCYLLGAPIWIQDEEGDEDLFLGQFDDTFADINLGDSGIMYLFSDTAFWQCY